MTYFGADTCPEIEKRMIEGLRAMSPAKRIERMVALNRMQRDVMLAGLRARHPEDSPEQIRRRLADLILGPELAARAYGPHPRAEDR